MSYESQHKISSAGLGTIEHVLHENSTPEDSTIQDRFLGLVDAMMFTFRDYARTVPFPPHNGKLIEFLNLRQQFEDESEVWVDFMHAIDARDLETARINLTERDKSGNWRQGYLYELNPNGEVIRTNQGDITAKQLSSNPENDISFDDADAAKKILKAMRDPELYEARELERKMGLNYVPIDANEVDNLTRFVATISPIK